MAKRRAAGEGSLRLRPDGLWEARATIGNDPGTGKPMRRSVYGKTQKEVREKLTEITSQLDRGTYSAPCKMRLGKWLDIWTEEYLGDVKASTAHVYREDVRLYIKPALGAKTLESLDAHTIQQFYNDLAKRLSPKTVKDIHGVLHAALDAAVSVKYIRDNPATGRKLPKREKPEIKPLDEKQQTDFLKAIEGHTHEIIYKIALCTGLRESELLGLTWDCVDFSKGTLTVKQQLRKDQRKGGAYYVSSPKNGKTRKVMPAPFVMELFKDQKQKMLEARFKAGNLWTDKITLDGREYDFVFRNEIGGLLSYRTVYDCFKRIVAGIGIPDARFHDLRHSYAVNALRAGDDIKTVSESLGHASAAFTADTYLHFVDSMRQASAERMEGFIKGVLNL